MSKHTDQMYRSYRARGFDSQLSIAEVYAEGAKAGGSGPIPVSVKEFGNTCYDISRQQGNSHEVALDDVFLTAFQAAQTGALKGLG